MTTQQRTLSWVAAFAAFLALVYLFQSVLLPFLVGLAVAYLLDPVCDRLEGMGCSRTVATTLVTVAFFLLVGVAIALLVPILYRQLTDFVAQIPSMLAALEAKARPLVDMVVDMQAKKGEGIEDLVRESMGNAAKVLGAVGSRLLSGLEAVFSLVSLVVITPVVAFYMLRDWDRMVAAIDGWLPRAHAGTIREQARLVDQTLAGFIRGQFTVCLLLGVFYAVGLTALQLPFGVVVGLGTGLVSFIPYVGMLSGFAIGMGIAIASFDAPLSIALVAAVFIAGQIFEGNFLTPKMVGDRVNLHAVWIIFALMAGGAVFGFVGILLAVPVAAVIGVLVRFALSRYLASPLYLADYAGAHSTAIAEGPPLPPAAQPEPGQPVDPA